MIEDEAEARLWLEALPGVTEQVMARLDRLVELLTKENARQNLVSASSLMRVWQRHIADSAQLLRYVSRETAQSVWLDLGTGAGFPGLVVATIRPDWEVLLVESRPLRAQWLEAACAALGLASARVIGGRLEQVETRKVDVISARAFAPLERLLDLSARFSTSATIWLLPKGRSAAQELAELNGWNHAFHVEQSLTDSAAGIVVGHLTGTKSGVKR